MRQVPHDAGSPAHHLLLGSGRFSRHLSRYFSLEGLSFTNWDFPREISEAFFSLLTDREKPVTHLWILVSDSAIATVAAPILAHFSTTSLSPAPMLLHASGAQVIPGLRSVHPLMTFGNEYYNHATYHRIPFVLEAQYDGETEKTILGGLPNPAVFLEGEKRPLYHALVSASGNFPSLLWADVFHRFEKGLSLPRELLAPFLFQSLTNLIRSGEEAITGPIIRGDHATVRAHQTALAGTPLGDLYAAFVKFFNETQGASHVGHPDHP